MWNGKRSGCTYLDWDGLLTYSISRHKFTYALNIKNPDLRLGVCLAIPLRSRIDWAPSPHYFMIARFHELFFIFYRSHHRSHSHRWLRIETERFSKVPLSFSFVRDFADFVADETHVWIRFLDCHLFNLLYEVIHRSTRWHFSSWSRETELETALISIRFLY